MASVKLQSDVLCAEGVCVEELAKELAAASAAKQLVVIADFDRTLTNAFAADRGPGVTSHGVLETGGVLSEKFQSVAHALFQKYHPIETDTSISIQEKMPVMKEWYSGVHEAMLSEGVTLDKIRGAVEAAKGPLRLREGVADFLKACQDAVPPVPVIIMSAGLGTVIEEVFRQLLPFELAPTTSIVSNWMQFDQEGHLQGFSEPLLHMFNKSAAFMPEASKALVADKKTCLLLGDGLGDLTMADGLDIHSIKVGFLNEKVDERLSSYLGPFSVVVTNDGPLPEFCLSALAARSS
mmetsp:Transcript_44580/g.105679  ORF Transcript_44580/g.105679 Transcript_44580/m.105679 type:complete len:294 (-) Transcript_44580:83-964(-)